MTPALFIIGMGVIAAGLFFWLGLRGSQPEGVLLVFALAATALAYPLNNMAAPAFDRVMSPKAQAEVMREYVKEGYIPVSYKDYGGNVFLLHPLGHPRNGQPGANRRARAREQSSSGHEALGPYRVEGKTGLLHRGAQPVYRNQRTGAAGLPSQRTAPGRPVAAGIQTNGPRAAHGPGSIEAFRARAGRERTSAPQSGHAG